ncbi:MAG TPA: RluA family pseudouridine synthase [Candidatus Deferrimicrobiaceae bacterium]
MQGRSIRLALERGEVSIDGRKGNKGDFVRAGQVVSVRSLAENTDWEPVPGDIPGASVVYSDESVAILDKPAGVQTEPVKVREAGTLSGYLLWRFPGRFGWCESAGGPLLSRLDRDTSGVVLGALTLEAYRFLLAERESGRLMKRYLCTVEGIFPGPAILKGVIETQGGERVRVRHDTPDPQSIYWTHVVPLQEEDGCTIVCARIVKGRRHQIRAHLAAAGFPIRGDGLYGNRETGDSIRLMLHAAEVTFNHPATGEPMTVSAPIPGVFGIQRLP